MCFLLFSLFLIVPGLQSEQKRFQLEELRKFGAQFKVREVWERARIKWDVGGLIGEAQD